MGFFSKIASALKKTKDAIASKISALFTRDGIGADFYNDLTDILISSDICVETAETIVANLRESMKKERVVDKEVVIENLKKVIADILEDTDDFDFEYPAVIMVIGVNGVGKTTTIGKLANYYINNKKTVTLAAADTFRAAAGDQLGIWADRAKVRVIRQADGADPSSVVYDAAVSAKSKGTDVLIIDTAGRLHVKANLMEELKKMARVVEREYPQANFYKLIVLDATTGQNALSQVELFDEAVRLDGVVLTKLDGSAKGGFILSVAERYGIPVKFVGTGEKIDDLELFDAKEFADSLL
ncbi:MAG: signal recognition particle-docking protein FtsY [Clostridia bacterium]|nr:signal recognition particle-docking protein FtsY [Clostridia bacterium]